MIIKTRIEDTRKRLEERLRDLTGKVREGKQELRESSSEKMRGLSSEGDVAEISASTGVESILMSRAQTALNIKTALDRIAQGVYGICIECEEPIAVKRLDKIPEASRCVECQARIERLDRRNRFDGVASDAGRNIEDQ